MELYYNGNDKTVGNNHDQQYEYAVVEVPYTPYATKDISLVPEDFYIIIEGENISGQSFVMEEIVKITVLGGGNNYYETILNFQDSRTIKKKNGGRVYIYFGCTLENVEEIFYKNNKLPLYN
ncbi:MAG: hypothetical protein E7374_00885 [Clostridiales bacterium]|nr:hypothetical protein [Clostridiales bacterium]